MALRDLLIRIGHDIDLSGLEEAQEMIDDYRSSYIELEEHMQDMGVAGAGTMETMSDSTRDADLAVQKMGDTGKQAGDEINREFKKTEQTLGDIATEGPRAFSGIQSAIAGVIGLGISGYFISAASNLEVAMLRMEAFAGTDDELQRLNRALKDTVAFSQGIHREGELAEAAHKALMLGVSMDIVSESMQDAAVIAAVTGDDINAVMRQIGRAIEIGTLEQLREMGIVTEETFDKLGEVQTESIRNWDRYRRELLVMTGVQDYAASKMDWYNEYLDTADAKTRSLSGAMGDLAEAAGSPLLGPMITITDSVTEFTDGIGKNEAELLGWGAVIGGIGAGVWGLVAGLTAAKAPLLVAGALLGKAAVVGGAIVGTALLMEDVVRGFLGMPSISGDIQSGIQNRMMELAGIEKGIAGLSDTQYAAMYPIQYSMEKAGLRVPRTTTSSETAGYVSRHREHPAFAPTIQINVDGNVAGSPGIESQMKRIAERVFRPTLEREWRKLSTQLNNPGVH